MSRWPNKYVIGLTGNIATGKSVVRQMLQHSGAYTIDADQLAHQTMLPGAPAYKPIVQTFGKMILQPDGKIDRQKLGRIAFSNAEALRRLEAITHPIIRQGVNALVSRSKKRVVVVEAIKLLDGEMKDWVDEIWVVNAKPQTQYKRLIGKRKMSADDAKARILAQGKQADKLKQAKVIIENDGDVEQTWKQVQAQWARLRQELTGQATPAAPQQSKPTATPATDKTSTTTQEAAAAAAADTMSPEAASIDVSGMTVRSGMPGNAALIAEFITARSGKDVSRMDVMMNFGQKSYLLAQNSEEKVLSLIGWTVENLVTRMDEFYVAPGVPVKDAVHAIVVAVEERSSELQSEVGFIFLPQNTSQETIAAFKADGYESTTLDQIKVPVWREAVDEATSDGDLQVLWKQLRQDRVLQPI